MAAVRTQAVDLLSKAGHLLQGEPEINIGDTPNSDECKGQDSLQLLALSAQPLQSLGSTALCSLHLAPVQSHRELTRELHISAEPNNWKSLTTAAVSEATAC